MNAIPHQYEEAPDLKEMASKIIGCKEDVGHVRLESVLFLREVNSVGLPHLAKCYKLSGQPYQFFTDCQWCIVVFKNMVDYMTDNQLKILMWHELKHIHPFLDKLVAHNVKDFYTMMKLDVDWSEPNNEVIDILKV